MSSIMSVHLWEMGQVLCHPTQRPPWCRWQMGLARHSQFAAPCKGTPHIHLWAAHWPVACITCAAAPRLWAHGLGCPHNCYMHLAKMVWVLRSTIHGPGLPLPPPLLPLAPPFAAAFPHPRYCHPSRCRWRHRICCCYATPSAVVVATAFAVVVASAAVAVAVATACGCCCGCCIADRSCVAAVVQCTQGSSVAAAASNKVAARASRARLYGLGNHANARAQPLSWYHLLLLLLLHCLLQMVGGEGMGVGGQGRKGAAGTKCTPRKKIAQGSAPGSARFVLYEGGGRQRTAGRREERGERSRPRCGFLENLFFIINLLLK